jgi:TonB family protein
MSRAFFRSVLLLASLGVAPLAAAAETGIWTPAGPWQLDQQPDQCTLQRPFQSGEQRLVMQVQPNLYSTAHAFKLASESALGATRSGNIDFTLGTHAPHQGYGAIEATAGGRERVLLWTTGKEFSFPDIVADEQTARLASEGGFAATMQWQGARKAFAALRDCQDKVAAAKGEDAAARRAYRRELEPAGNAGRWVTYADYPRKAERDRRQGLTAFRLTVDRGGSVTRCEITQSSGSAILDERTCGLLMQRARFTPALDANGVAVGATYSNRVDWALPQ